MIPVADKCETAATVPVNAVLLAAGVLGFSYATTQLALMRELLTAFSGNEMVLGFVLGGWLLLMGIGTWAGRFSERLGSPVVWLAICQALLAIMPPIQIFMLRWLRNIVFIRGAEVDPAQTFCAVLVLLLPYCIPGGLALALASASLLASDGAKAVGLIYAADAVGSVVGGLLFTLMLVHFLDHVALLLIPAAANLLMAGVLALRYGRPGIAVVNFASAIAFPLTGFVGHADAVSARLQYPHQEIVARANSEYGNLLLLKADGQVDVLQNNIPVGSSRDNYHSEETVHYAMAQRPDARHVLLAGGSLSGSLAELLKYSTLERIDCVELDPALLRLSGQLASAVASDPRVHLLPSDPGAFLAQVPPDGSYGVIILDVPPPSTAALNRFFTVEFFTQARKVLARDGVLAFSLGEYANYVSPHFARVLASTRATAASQFANVQLIPGARVFCLASDGPLFKDIASRIEAKRIPIALLKRSYLQSQLSPDRFQDLERAAAIPAPMNRDFSPVLYFLHLRHWLSQFDSRLGFAFGLVALSLLGYVAWLFCLKSTALVMFSAGFAGTALQLVLLLSYQVLCGSVYYQLGLIITLFMAGLALGAWLANQRLWSSARWLRTDSRLLLFLAGLTAVFALLLPYCVRWLGTWRDVHEGVLGVKILIGLLAFELAALLGGQFAIANRVEFDATMEPASRLYTADFLGSFTGAIITSTALIPLLGVAATCFITAALNLITAAIFGFRIRFA